MTDNDRNAEIKPILEAIHEHLRDLPDGEFARMQNNAEQVIACDGLRISMNVKTSAGDAGFLGAINARSQAAASVAPAKTPADERADLAARVAAANAREQARSGILIDDRPLGERKYDGGEQRFPQEAETVVPCDADDS